MKDIFGSAFRDLYYLLIPRSLLKNHFFHNRNQFNQIENKSTPEAKELLGDISTIIYINAMEQVVGKIPRLSLLSFFTLLLTWLVILTYCFLVFITKDFSSVLNLLTNDLIGYLSFSITFLAFLYYFVLEPYFVLVKQNNKEIKSFYFRGLKK